MTLTELGIYMVSRGLAATFLSTPGAPTVTPQGTSGATTYGYRIVAKNTLGQTLGSTAGTTATGNATLNGANFNRVTWTTVTGATGYDIYRSTGGATQGLIGSASSATFDDTGLVGNGAATPGANTAATDIGLGALPSSPDKAFALVPVQPEERTSIPSVGRFGSDATFREYPEIQLLTRSQASDTQDVLTRANTAYLELAKIQAQQLSGVLYENVQPKNPPILLTPDGSGRPIASLDLLVTKEPSLS